MDTNTDPIMINTEQNTSLRLNSVHKAIMDIIMAHIEYVILRPVALTGPIESMAL